jgi:hypothetical protein
MSLGGNFIIIDSFNCSYHYFYTLQGVRQPPEVFLTAAAVAALTAAALVLAADTRGRKARNQTVKSSLATMGTEQFLPGLAQLAELF